MTRIAPFVVILVLAACSRSTPAAASSEAAAPQESPATASAAAPAEIAKPVPAQLPDVVARVNGEVIDRAELEMAIGEIEARAGQPMPADQRDRIIRGVLDQLIGYRLLQQEAAARKIVVPEPDLDARIAEIRAQFPSQEAFTQTLEARKMTLAALRADAREGMQIDAMLKTALAATAAVTPEQVAEFYGKNPSEFQQGERVRASHILIRLPENADAAAREQARGRAAEVLKALKAGNDFADIAKNVSEDPGSAPAGGDLGYFGRGQMVGPFEQAAFSLAPAQTSDIVESPFGYHIIRVADKQRSRTIPLAEVRERIQQYLEGQSREQQTQAFVESLKAKGKVDTYI